MPMGVISDAELQAELDRNGVPAEQELQYVPPSRSARTPDIMTTPITKVTGSGNHGLQGRDVGDKNVPDVLRTLIAQDAIENGRKSAVSLAEGFGISPSSVSAYTNGVNSTAQMGTPLAKPNTPLKTSIELTKQRLAKKAANRLGIALGQITEEKLESASLKTISAVAKDMAVVIKQMEPSENNNGGPQGPAVQVVLFAPPQMKEADFPVITVKE